jgi:hypothetical protein
MKKKMDFQSSFGLALAFVSIMWTNVPAFSLTLQKSVGAERHA